MENGKSSLNQKSQDIQTFEEWYSKNVSDLDMPHYSEIKKAYFACWEAGHTAGEEVGYSYGFDAGWTEGFWNGKEDERSIYV